MAFFDWSVFPFLALLFFPILDSFRDTQTFSMVLGGILSLKNVVREMHLQYGVS